MKALYHLNLKEHATIMQHVFFDLSLIFYETKLRKIVFNTELTKK